jgi:hypothetical protein
MVLFLLQMRSFLPLVESKPELQIQTSFLQEVKSKLKMNLSVVCQTIWERPRVVYKATLGSKMQQKEKIFLSKGDGQTWGVQRREGFEFAFGIQLEKCHKPTRGGTLPLGWKEGSREPDQGIQMGDQSLPSLKADLIFPFLSPIPAHTLILRVQIQVLYAVINPMDAERSKLGSS